MAGTPFDVPPVLIALPAGGGASGGWHAWRSAPSNGPWAPGRWRSAKSSIPGPGYERPLSEVRLHHTARGRSALARTGDSVTSRGGRERTTCGFAGRLEHEMAEASGCCLASPPSGKRHQLALAWAQIACGDGSLRVWRHSRGRRAVGGGCLATCLRRAPRRELTLAWAYAEAPSGVLRADTFVGARARPGAEADLMSGVVGEDGFRLGLQRHRATLGRVVPSLGRVS